MGCGASQQAPPGGFEAVDAGANAPEPLASQGKSGKVTRGSVIGDLPVIRRMSLRKPGPTAAPVLVQPVSESEGSFTKSAEKASYVAPVQAVPRRVSLSITTTNKKQQQAGDTPSPRQLKKRTSRGVSIQEETEEQSTQEPAQRSASVVGEAKVSPRMSLGQPIQEGGESGRQESIDAAPAPAIAAAIAEGAEEAEEAEAPAA